MNEWQKKKVLELHADGLGYKAISDELGISVSRIRYLIAHPVQKNEDICLQCGKPLKMIPHHKRKKFCGDMNRMRWWNSHLDQVNRQAFSRRQRTGRSLFSMMTIN